MSPLGSHGKFPRLPPPSGDANACSVLRHRPVFGGQNPKKILFRKKCLLWGGKFPRLSPPRGEANACSILRHHLVIHFGYI